MLAAWGEDLARRVMRGPRYLPEPSLVEITVRTIQSRFLLVLTKIVAETIIAVIERAQERYGVSVIDVKQMSSHVLCGAST
jgi:hypothetical protein